MRRMSVLSLLVIAACGQEEARAPELVRPVRAILIGDIAGFQQDSFTGRAEATQEVNLSFRVSGPLVERPVNVGDRVKRGQMLAQIDPRDYKVALRNASGQLEHARATLEAMETGARPEEIKKLRAAVQSAEAEFTRAKNDYGRFKKAIENKAVSQSDVDRAYQLAELADAALKTARENLRIGEVGARKEDINAQKARVRSLEAARDAAADQLSYATLKAPFDGTVSATFVENYQTVQAKQPILRLLDTSRIEMTVDIPEQYISLAPYVTELTCEFDAFPGKTISARIKEVGTEASTMTRTYPVTIIMDQPKEFTVLPGMAGTARARVEVPGEVQKAGFVVPFSALLRDQGKTYVWIIDEGSGTARRREVQTGKLHARGIVVSGIKKGDWVATAGAHSLTDGQKVRIQSETKP
ncbi:MAG: efflux RND transporter periplasmic adaptor subunit [Planctomycetota bacterium]